MNAPQTAQVIPLTKRDRRELAYKRRLHAVGAPTREAVLYKFEAMQTDLDYWYRKAMLGKYLTDRLLMLMREANARYAESERLRIAAEAEVKRLKRWSD